MAASSPHLYLASDEARFTNGVDLVVDGGRAEL
jgi:NAD(P)-dependent dehydrogenase (short-subunit alcohol dehydrogenase family)